MVYKSKTRTIKNKKNFKSQMGGEGGLPENNVPPTLRDNIKKFADIWLQTFNNLSMYTLDKIEDKIKDVSIKWGVNPNSSIKTEIQKLGQKAEQINDALDTPQGKKALADLTELFNRITKNVIVPSSRKLTEQLIENLQPIMVKGQNAVFALLSASPFGAIIDIPRFVSESLGVIEKSVTLADDVLDIGIDTVDQIKSEEGAFNSVLSEFDSLTESANAKISSGLDSVKSTVDNYGKGLMSSDMKTGLTSSMDGMKSGMDGMTSGMDGIKSGFSGMKSGFSGMKSGMEGMKTGLSTGNVEGIKSGFSGMKTGMNGMTSGMDGMKSGLNDVNKSFQQYKKESTMIGGRVKNAYSEFVSPIINSQKMLKQYGGTRKKRIIRQNRCSRRR